MKERLKGEAGKVVLGERRDQRGKSDFGYVRRWTFLEHEIGKVREMAFRVKID